MGLQVDEVDPEDEKDKEAARLQAIRVAALAKEGKGPDGKPLPTEAELKAAAKKKRGVAVGGGGGGGEDEAKKKKKKGPGLLVGAEGGRGGAGGDPALPRSNTPLVVTVAALGDARMVELLLQFGAYPDAADRRGVTPLIAAAARGHHVVVFKIIEKLRDLVQSAHATQIRTPRRGARAGTHTRRHARAHHCMPTRARTQVPPRARSHRATCRRAPLAKKAPPPPMCPCAAHLSKFLPRGRSRSTAALAAR